MTKLLKNIVITLSIIAGALIFNPVSAKAEEQQADFNYIQLNAITLQTAYNRLIDLNLASNPKQITPFKIIDKNIITYAMDNLTSLGVDTDTMLGIYLSGRKESIFYGAKPLQ